MKYRFFAPKSVLIFAAVSLGTVRTKVRLQFSNQSLHMLAAKHINTNLISFHQFLCYTYQELFVLIFKYCLKSKSNNKYFLITLYISDSVLSF